MKARCRPDDGFTLVETMIASLATLVVFAIAFSAIVGIQEEEQTSGATIAGARQAQLSTMDVLQYIRAAYALASVTGAAAGSTSSSFTLDVYSGTSQGALTPNSSQVTVTYAAGKPAGTLTTQSTGLVGAPPSTTNLKNSFITDDVIAPAATIPVFSYYAYQQGAAPGTVETISDPAKCLGNIVAIGIDVSFSLPGGATVTPGAIPSSATTLATITYLHDVTTAATVPAGGVC